MDRLVLQHFILIFTVSASAISVPSCCPDDQILDTDTMACVRGDSGPLDLSDFSDPSDTQITLDSVNSMIPTCAEGNLETFSMQKHPSAKLLADGHLMTKKYGDSRVRDFCVSATATQDVVAVSCDPCASGQVCYCIVLLASTKSRFYIHLMLGFITLGRLDRETLLYNL